MAWRFPNTSTKRSPHYDAQEAVNSSLARDLNKDTRYGIHRRQADTAPDLTLTRTLLYRAVE